MKKTKEKINTLPQNSSSNMQSNDKDDGKSKPFDSRNIPSFNPFMLKLSEPKSDLKRNFKQHEFKRKLYTSKGDRIDKPQPELREPLYRNIITPQKRLLKPTQADFITQYNDRLFIAERYHKFFELLAKSHYLSEPYIDTDLDLFCYGYAGPDRIFMEEIEQLDRITRIKTNKTYRVRLRVVDQDVSRRGNSRKVYIIAVRFLDSQPEYQWIKLDDIVKELQ